MSQPKVLNFIFIAIGILFMGLGLPLFLGKVSPNGLYGMRTAKTMSNPEIWYAANRSTGIDLMGAGAVILLTAIVVLAIGGEYDMKKVGLINLAAVVLSIGVAVAHSFMVAGRL